MLPQASSVEPDIAEAGAHAQIVSSVAMRRRNIPSVSDAPKTLLRVGASEWEEINREESRERIEWAQSRTIEELVAAGASLSATAHQVLQAVGNAPKRDARSA